MSYLQGYEGPTGDVLEHVLAERRRQESLKASGKFAFTCADLEMNHHERFTVLGEEFGEVGHELNEAIGPGRAMDLVKLRTELVQVAAVAVAWCEAIDREAAK